MGFEHLILFREFANKAIDPDNAQDPTVLEMRKIADEKGLTLVFNKMDGNHGGLTAMPPPSQVDISLIKVDNEWRMLI